MVIEEEVVECSATRVSMFNHWITESINNYEGILENKIDVVNNP